MGSVTGKMVWLLLVATTLAISIVAPVRAEAVTPARTGPVLLGTAFQYGQIQNNPTYRTQLLSHGYTVLTPEWEAKMDQVETSSGVFDFSKPDAMLQFAEDNGLQMRGHALVWGQQVPAWVTNPSSPWTRTTLLAVMNDWITTAVSRYAGRIHAWDVVNEPLNDDGTYKQNIWQQVIGNDYIEQALRTAHDADPTARLYVNEYSAEWIWPKSNALYAIALDFKSRGVPLDGIGFQVHSDTRWPVPYADLVANMTRFGNLGLRTDITEMDVGTSHYAGTTAQKYEAQRVIYSDAAHACKISPSCWAFTTWGFTDNYTCLGSAELPLPFDTSYQAKPRGAITSQLLVPSVGGIAESPQLAPLRSASANPDKRNPGSALAVVGGAVLLLVCGSAWVRRRLSSS